MLFINLLLTHLFIIIIAFVLLTYLLHIADRIAAFAARNHITYAALHCHIIAYAPHRADRSPCTPQQHRTSPDIAYYRIYRHIRADRRYCHCIISFTIPLHRGHFIR